MNKRRYFPTAVALYITYFMIGISMTIVGQYKQEFAQAWGANKIADGSYDISSVMAAIAAIGLGRLIAFPIAGPFSDRLGRKKSALVAMLFLIAFFTILPFTTNPAIAYILLMCSGIGNSFLDTSVTPSCMEIFSENGAVANLFTKFSISVGQFVLPIFILMLAKKGMTYHKLFLMVAVAAVLDLIAIIALPFPKQVESAEKNVKKRKIRLSASLLLLIGIGFTSTATFMIFLNCNQELGILYGLENPQIIQSFYSTGIVAAIFVTSALVKKGLKPIRILMVYPVAAFLTLLVMYLVKIPQICLAGGFMMGFFAAGGVLQLATSTANEIYPEHKGTITAMVMFASAVSNYVVINVAGLLMRTGGANGPGYILLFNMAITFVGILLAIILNVKYSTQLKN